MRITSKRNFWPGAPPLLPNWEIENVDFGWKSCKKKNDFWKCCRNLYHKVLPKFLATWWGPSTPEMSGDAVSGNSIDYLQSYEFLKFGGKCKKSLIFCVSKTRMNWYFKICSASIRKCIARFEKLIGMYLLTFVSKF